MQEPFTRIPNLVLTQKSHLAPTSVFPRTRQKGANCSVGGGQEVRPSTVLEINRKFKDAFFVSVLLEEQKVRGSG